MGRCIVIGGSHAASQFVISLRQGGWDGDIILIGDEAELPYHRPPLSKEFLSGSKGINEILIRPEQTYLDANIMLELGKRVTTINRDARTITLSDGGMLEYDKLVLATGARVRTLAVDGADHPRVMYLRNSDHVRKIKAAIGSAKQAVIIGGGYIGLETAASLCKQGMEVTVLEAMDRILQRVTAPIMSDFYRRIHIEEGVRIIENEMVASITHADDISTVHAKSGNAYPADIVIVGIGVIPNTELAAQADLEVGDGIVINPFCQTSDPDIYAIGDVSWHHNPTYDSHIRLESVPNANEQAKIAALHLNGIQKPYNSVPWFWSDQFDLKLQIAGLFQGYDDVIIRGDNKGSRRFAAFYFKEKRLLAVDAVNAPQEFMLTKMALTKGQTLDKQNLADINVSLKSLLV